MTTRRSRAAKTASGETGFSMLEAVVAIGILAAALLPLLEFQLRVADGAHRLSGYQETVEQEARAVAYLRALPAGDLESGQAELGAVQLSWKTRATAAARRGISEQGGPGRFDINVVRLEYELRKDDSLVKKGVLDRLVWEGVTPFFDQQGAGSVQ